MIKAPYAILSPEKIEKDLKEQYYFTIISNGSFLSNSYKSNTLLKYFSKLFCVPKSKKEADKGFINYIVAKYGKLGMKGKRKLIYILRKRILYFFFKKMSMFFGFKLNQILINSLSDNLSVEFKTMLSEKWLLQVDYYKLKHFKNWNFSFINDFYFVFRKRYQIDIEIKKSWLSVEERRKLEIREELEEKRKLQEQKERLFMINEIKRKKEEKKKQEELEKIKKQEELEKRRKQEELEKKFTQNVKKKKNKKTKNKKIKLEFNFNPINKKAKEIKLSSIIDNNISSKIKENESVRLQNELNLLSRLESNLFIRKEENELNYIKKQFELKRKRKIVEWNKNSTEEELYKIKKEDKISKIIIHNEFYEKEWKFDKELEEIAMRRQVLIERQSTLFKEKEKIFEDQKKVENEIRVENLKNKYGEIFENEKKVENPKKIGIGLFFENIIKEEEEKLKRKYNKKIEEENNEENNEEEDEEITKFRALLKDHLNIKKTKKEKEIIPIDFYYDTKNDYLYREVDRSEEENKKEEYLEKIDKSEEEKVGEILVEDEYNKEKDNDEIDELANFRALLKDHLNIKKTKEEKDKSEEDNIKDEEILGKDDLDVDDDFFVDDDDYDYYKEEEDLNNDKKKEEEVNIKNEPILDEDDLDDDFVNDDDIKDEPILNEDDLDDDFVNDNDYYKEKEDLNNDKKKEEEVNIKNEEKKVEEILVDVEDYKEEILEEEDLDELAKNEFIKRDKKVKDKSFKSEFKKKWQKNSEYDYNPDNRIKKNDDPYQVAFDYYQADISKIAEISAISFEQLSKFGVHLGYTLNIKSTYAAWLTYAIREDIMIISLYKFITMLRIGFLFVDKAVFTMSPIWFTSMFPAYFEYVIYAAITCGELSCTSEWINGLLSNFLVIFKSLSMYKRFPKDLRPKSLHVSLDMNNWLLGRFSWPRVVFVTGFKKSSFIGKEAISLRIPCLSIMDTDSPSHIASVPIPANDDNWRANIFYGELMSTFIIYRKAVYVILWFISVRRAVRKLKFSEWLSKNIENFSKLNEKKSLINNLIEEHEFNFFFSKEASSIFLEQMALRYFIFKGPIEKSNNKEHFGLSFFFKPQKESGISSFFLEEKKIFQILKEEEEIKALEHKLIYGDYFSIDDELEFLKLKRKREARKQAIIKKEKPYYRISEKYAEDYFWTIFSKLHNYLIISHSIYLLKNAIWNRSSFFLDTNRGNVKYPLFPTELKKWRRRRRYVRRRRFNRKKLSVFYPKSRSKLRHLRKCFAMKGYKYPKKNKKIRRFLKSFAYNNYIFNYNNNNLFKKFNIIKKSPIGFIGSKFFKKIIKYRKRLYIKQQDLGISLLNFGKRNRFFNRNLFKDSKFITKIKLSWDLDYFRNKWLKSFFIGRRFTLLRSKGLLRSLFKSYFDFFFFFLQYNIIKKV